MVFSHNETFLNIQINNIILQRVQKTKFLGIVFDHNLSFKFYYEELLSKVSRVAGLTHRSRNLVPRAVLKTLYLSLGWSRISYGIVMWGMSSQTYRNELQLLQNQIIKSIYGCNNVSTFKPNGLIQFFDAFNYFAAMKLFKELNHSVVPYLNAKICSLQRNHNYPTRFTTNHNLIPPRFVKTKCQSSFIFQSIAF